MTRCRSAACFSNSFRRWCSLRRCCLRVHEAGTKDFNDEPAHNRPLHMGPLFLHDQLIVQLLLVNLALSLPTHTGIARSAAASMEGGAHSLASCRCRSACALRIWMSKA